MKQPLSRGSVLLVSLWALGFFTSVTVAQAARVALQARWVGREQERLRAGQMVRTGVSYALWQLDKDSERTRDDKTEDWAHPEKWATPAFSPGQDAWEVKKISDAQSKMLLSEVQMEHLEKIPQLKDVAGQLIDRRAERPFVHLEELVVRLGLEPGRVAELAPLLRTQGTTKALNIYTVSPQALEILGLSRDLAQRIFDFVEANTQEGQPPLFQSAGEIGSALSGPLGFTAEESASVAALVAGQWLDVKSSCFEVEVQATAFPHAVKRSVRAFIVRSDPGVPIKVVEWRER
ncbi:MAG: general secretion pathway protein GspK [Candidatus Omnitrophica bacterium]|nr:general secretion pathway protein GspK [Candidatus Omnitrophota bacterium]